MRINKSVFRYIEHEMYNYIQTKLDLALYREQILHGTQVPEVMAKTGPGDIVSSKAIRLTSSAFVVQAERTINAIDRSLKMLGENHVMVFKLKYCDCRPWQEVALEMGISDRSYFRFRRELVATVGQQLGILDIE